VRRSADLHRNTVERGRRGSALDRDVSAKGARFGYGASLRDAALTPEQLREELRRGSLPASDIAAVGS
jgi:hypothetical protein